MSARTRWPRYAGKSVDGSVPVRFVVPIGAAIVAVSLVIFAVDSVAERDTFESLQEEMRSLRVQAAADLDPLPRLPRPQAVPILVERDPFLASR